jgi:hypothetical protein
MAFKARCHTTPGLFRWPLRRRERFSGCRRARLHPPASEAGPRWFKSSHPDCKRKGKPTGDGTRLEPGRATSLEGSTPSPSAANEVPVAERPRRRSSKPDRRVRLPRGTLTDGSLTRRRTTGPVGNRQTTQAQTLGCWGSYPPWATDRRPGGPARSGRHVLTVESRGSNTLQGTDCRVGWAPARPSGCNPPAFAVQVQLLPDTLLRWPCSSTGRARLS